MDVECPRDLITAFLLARNEKKELEYSLEPKINAWYWGCELIEAILLGYKVTRVYEIKEFERLEFLFSDFVTFCWDGRKRFPKPAVENRAFKEIMCLGTIGLSALDLLN